MTSQPIRHPVRILGIDPGLRRTGWGVIEIDGNRLTFVGCGSVEPPDGLPLASRLLAIHEGLAAVLGDFRPAEAAVEQTFVNKDGVATLKLGQARTRTSGSAFWVTSLTTAIESAPAEKISRACSSLMPPIATSGSEPTRFFHSVILGMPCGANRIDFNVVGKIGPSAM